MFKKVVLGLGCLGLMVGTGFAFWNPPCSGDDCKVDRAYQANIGVDLNLDFDVCLDLPSELCSYQGCEQAVIVQSGEKNSGTITQNGANFALIHQNGNENTAEITQTAQGATALAFQIGNLNEATITQEVAASAIITQFGTGNIAEITQK